MKQNLEVMCEIANEARGLAIDMIEKAGSGHPGLPLGCAELGVLLWGKVLKYQTDDPNWINRDRFILSAGHGSAWLYSFLHLSGYAFSIEDLKNFRQFGGKTPGHPEYDVNLGIETTTGPLGQGVANAVGHALGRKALGCRFPDLIDYKIYVLASDGDIMEGISSEAFSFAGHLGLNDLIVIYDDNRITIDGRTDLSFSEDMKKKMEALGWRVVELDAYEWIELQDQLLEAREEKEKPVFVILRSVIGKGSVTKEDQSAVHGAPLGKDDFPMTKKALGLPESISFTTTKTSYDFFKRHQLKVKEEYDKWNEKLKSFLSDENNKKLWCRWFGKETKKEVFDKLAEYRVEKPTATRVINGDLLNIVSEYFPGLMGGSADLASSVKTVIKKDRPFLKGQRNGRNIHYGIREHAMGGIVNGLAQTPGVWPFASTFFVFSDYMRCGIRLSAMMNLPVIYFFSHDSFYVGEDGPTHQPVEHLDALSLIPNLIIFRPGNDRETALAWRYMISHYKHPFVVLLTRQNLEPYCSEKTNDGFDKGIYLFQGEGRADAKIFVSGSELEKGVKTAELLKEKNINCHVYSAPSLSLFERQGEDYKKEITNSDVPCIVVEAGSGHRWDSVFKTNYHFMGVRQFGISGPWKKLEEYFGLSPKRISEKIETILK